MTQATLKVVGAFLGLSQDRANARRYPAIHPLESWSKYRSFADADMIETSKAMLLTGNEIHQLMMVVGEEGTSNEDFETYLKAELVDSVYLQQNAFDPVDSATAPDRQVRVFEKIDQVLVKEFGFESKDEAREFFNGLRQSFLDWNYSAPDSEEFVAREADIDRMIAEGRVVGSEEPREEASIAAGV